MGENSENERKQQMLETLLYEYELLKEEQTSRIGFRDNLLYVTLTLYGALAAFTLLNPKHAYGLLALPWVSLILGWNYLVNDEKISTIGRYIRQKLATQLDELLQINQDKRFAFNWEKFHRQVDGQKRRKLIQFFIDLITFVLSGATALFFFWFITKDKDFIVYLVVIIDTLFLVGLGWEIYRHADLDQIF